MRARHRHFNPAQAGATLALDARYLNQANASAVSSWPSRPSGSFTMEQGTAANQPTLQLAAINGQNAVRFDGTNDRMQCARVATTSNFTCIVAVKGSGQDGKIVLAQHAGTADLGRTVFVLTGGSSPFQTSRLFFNNAGGSRVLESTTDVFNNTATLICSESNGSGSSHLRVKNGAKEGTLTGQSWTPFNTNMTLGDYGPSQSGAFNGDISSVAFFTTQ